MLWSAYYPCRWARLTSCLWTRQRPRFFRFPVRSARWMDRGRRLSIFHSRRLVAHASRPFPSRVPERLLTAHSLDTAQSSGWGSSQACYHLCLRQTAKSSSFAGPDRTPRLYAAWLGSVTRANPGALNSCTRCPARLPSGIQRTLLRRTFSSQFLIRLPAVPITSVGTLRRACGRHAHPVVYVSPHPWCETRIEYPVEDATAPPTLSLAGAVEAHAFELPDVLSFTSGPDCDLSRLPLRSHGWHFLFTAPGPH